MIGYLPDEDEREVFERYLERNGIEDEREIQEAWRDFIDDLEAVEVGKLRFTLTD